MPSRWRFFSFLFAFSTYLYAAVPNETNSDSVSLQQALHRLSVTGKVLIIAAHPDDENTALISYLARGRNVHTAYLSLTRGEGGQNVIGPEQGAALGVIRTQELLQSRRIDGAQQFFTRAIDFGFCKDPNEAMDKWGKQAVLGDIVWVIRKFRPDVVILQFTGTSRDGHGHHQASSLLGRQAFSVAGDARQFPEQLKFVQPWKPTRLMMNRRAFTPQMEEENKKLSSKIELEIGNYDPVLGYSYGELAGLSRSFNRSQSEGTARPRGDVKAILSNIEGPPAAKDLFDGIDLSWNRFHNGGLLAQKLAKATSAWKPEHPEAIIPYLAEARNEVKKLDSPESESLVRSIDEVIGRSVGLWLDASADREQIVTGESFPVRVTAIRRTNIPVIVKTLSIGQQQVAINPAGNLEVNHPRVFETQFKLNLNDTYTQPYWLVKPPAGSMYDVANQQLVGNAINPPFLQSATTIAIGDTDVVLYRPVHHRAIDRLLGELVNPVSVIPAVDLRFAVETTVFPDSASKRISVEVQSHVPSASGSVKLDTPQGWTVEPEEAPFSLKNTGEAAVVSFSVHPPSKANVAALKARIVNSTNAAMATNVGVKRIDYSHLPLITLFPHASMHLVRADAITLAKRVGYIVGAGDEVPTALAQLGCDIAMIDPKSLATLELSSFDAIVIGVRAYAEQPDLRSNQQRLLNFVHDGGTLIVQYHRVERNGSAGFSRFGPFPFTLANLRIVDEKAPVKFAKDSWLLRTPNRISASDFDGWVQERGLYFPKTWDPHYQTLFEMNDKNEEPLRGSTLVAPYGKGVYIYTALSWFRQLPTGVPGAYRIFANFLSASKSLHAAPGN